jgi:drug/metabolite transporter (DMT)-like permease
MVALILYFGYGEKFGPATRWSMLLALLGVVVISWEGENLRFNLVGTLIVLTSSLTYAVYMVIVNKGGLRASGLTVTFYSVLFSSGYYLIKLLLFTGAIGSPSVDKLGYISLFSLVTVVISVLFIVLAIQLIGSTPTAIVGALEPVVGVGVSILFFGERSTWTLFAGLVLVLSALVVNVLGTKDAESLSH